MEKKIHVTKQDPAKVGSCSYCARRNTEVFQIKSHDGNGIVVRFCLRCMGEMIEGVKAFNYR